MSKSVDRQPKVRLELDVYNRLQRIRDRNRFAPSITSMANEVVAEALPKLESKYGRK